MKKIGLMLALLWVICALSWASSPDARIKGQLIDASTNQVINYADIFLFTMGSEKPLQQTFPDDQGRFSFTKVAPGNYVVMVRLMGYDVFTKNDIILDASSPVDLGKLMMSPLEVGIAEVEVVAEKRQLVYKLDKKVVEASSNMMGGGGSAVDILENTPSIRVDAEGDVTFRGSSGFLVYIDGKPSVFSGTQALEQVPAGHIENIEIITTPSAKHDTEGDVGIINIITKKHSQRGLSGMVNLSGSTWLSRHVDFLLAQQHQRSRWYIGGQWTDRLRKSDFDQEKMTVVGDQTTTSHSVGPRTGDSYHYTLKGGWSLNLPKTTIALDLEGGYGGNKRKGEMNYKETRSVAGGSPVTEDYRSIDDYDNDENIGLGSLAVQHKFNDKGHELSGSAYYKYGGHALEYFFNDLMSLEGQRQQGHRAYEAEHRETMRINLDYALPFGKGGKLEAGYQYYSYLEDGDYNMEWWDPKGQTFFWRDDIYNTFYFQEGVNSIYTILSHTWKNLEAQAGVRGEHTHTVLRSSVEGADRTKNRFEFFPSVHLGYTFLNEHRLLASYSRRTTRPQLFYMEPYITYRDFYTAEIGNPDIRPEYINSFELNYRKNFGENTVSATAFHRYRKDKIERLDYPTGTVQVTLDDEGVPCYEIKEGVAWDNIPFTDELKRLALNTRAVCFGSLAQRNEVSRATINRFLDTMPDVDGQLKIFDINLRQDFYTKEVLRESFKRCNILKINDEELVTISRMFGYPGIDLQDKCWILLAKYNLKMLILTCGINGSYVFTPGVVSFQETPKVPVADTVGAGDSFTAAFCASILNGKSVPEAHKLAVEVSAYVCTQSGAMPELPVVLKDRLL